MQAPPIVPGGDPTLTPEPPVEPIGEIRSPRQIRRARRRVALSRFWKQYRRSKMGMAGLIILAFFVGVAIFAVFASDAGTDPSLVTDQPVGGCPVGSDVASTSEISSIVQTVVAELQKRGML